MTEEINPAINSYPHNYMTKTFEAQRKDRLGDSIGDYLTDEDCTPRKAYEEILSEVKTWVDYHDKNYKKAKALYDLLLCQETPDQFIK